MKSMSTVFDEAVLEDRPEIDLSVLPSLRADSEGVVVLAVDVGTSGTRAALFNNRGEQIDGSLITLPSEAYSSLISGSDIDAGSLVQSVAQTIDFALERAELFVSRIDYVAWSCFWHSLLGIDEAGKAITPLLGWADTRAADDAVELREQLDEKEFHPRTGCRFHPSYWPAKLRWLKRVQPNLFNRVRHWLSFSDYLFLQLLARPATSISMASATGIFDQTKCEWDRELLSEIGIDPEQLPSVAAPRSTVQGLGEQYSSRWPMLEGAAWFPAIGDGAANNIGLGCTARDRVALMLGTSSAMRMLSSRVAPQTLPSELFCYRADRDRVVIGGAISDGGSLLAWMKDVFGLNYDDDDLNRRLEEMGPDSHGLTVLPFWSGERATGWSASARGTIDGLNAGSKPIDILRAAMESICYRFALIGQALDSFTSGASIILAGKTFLSHPVWAQMMADVLGRQVELFPDPEVSIRGAALLALETIGTIDSIELVKSEPGRVFLPDMTRHETYTQAIRRQEDLYRRLNT
jgi:gluconokinase